MRVWPRIDILEPALKKALIEKDDPKQDASSTDIMLLNLTLERTENDDPSVVCPKAETALPHCARFLIERVDPKDKLSNRDICALTRN
jgi:hypothetical protein